MSTTNQPIRNPRIYAIGDIHGRLDLLKKMIEYIHADARAHGGTSLTVTLGDYVDRGPDSRGVIECLRVNPFPSHYLALRGNHEALLERFLEEPSIGTYWEQLGGMETLRSFGVDVKPSMRKRDYEVAAQKLGQALSPEQRAFLASLKTHLIVGRYFFCHAGVRPKVPLDRQDENDLLWIRDEFLKSNVDFGKIIVHGHTPVMKPEVLANRIDVDTGAFATGRLTCIVLEDDFNRFINT